MPTGRIVIIPFLRGKPDIDSILAKWLERHPEHRDKNYHVIRSKSHQLADEISTVLMRVTADFDEGLAAYNPADDADLYDEFLAKDDESAPTEPHKIWIQQCEAAENIEGEYGIEKALGYLIGEKLLYHLEVAETKPEWRTEIPSFIAKIKEIFEPWQIAQFLETPRRLGALGHTADEEGHKLYRSQLDESENLREDSRNLILFEQSREWLLEDQV
jgi:hypothetical protein